MTLTIPGLAPADVAVTPPRDAPLVTTQLRLIEGGRRPRLDARTRDLGRSGIAAARARLAAAQPPEPKTELSQAS